jgi:hypothetical protein
MRLSIRWRRTLWNLLALAVLLGFSALVYGLTARALCQQVDGNLRAGFRRQVEGDPRLSGDRDRRQQYWGQELHEHNGIFSAAYGSGGKVLARTEELAASKTRPLRRSSRGARVFGVTGREAGTVGTERMNGPPADNREARPS